MNFVTKITTQFKDPKILKKFETLNLFELEFSCTSSMPASKKEIEDVVASTFSDDAVRITISIAEQPFSYEKRLIENDRFWTILAQIQKPTDKEEIQITFTVTKSSSGALVRIYDLTSFTEYLLNLDVKTFLDVFNKKMGGGINKLLFLSDEISKSFHTESIFFIHELKEINTIVVNIDREKLVSKIQSVSYFTGISNLKLLPQDFYFKEKDGIPDPLYNKFSIICFVLLLTFMHDHAFIEENILDLKLNGYKTLHNKLDANHLPIASIEHYLKIYLWSVDQGSLNDKIGLVRNILSLNLPNLNDFSIDEAVFTSILSGYKVYEKQNVKQYIELRNKMADQLLAFNEKASKIIENFAGGFQKSALAFVSLFSSIIVIRVLTGHNFVNVFTLDATLISLAFLSISLIYYWASRWEVEEQKKRYIESYMNMKIRNEDLLTKDDINRILNDDKDYKSDLKFIQDKKRKYSRVWIGFIIIFFFLIVFLYSFYSISSFLHLKFFQFVF